MTSRHTNPFIWIFLADSWEQESRIDAWPSFSLIRRRPTSLPFKWVAATASIVWFQHSVILLFTSGLTPLGWLGPFFDWHIDCLVVVYGWFQARGLHINLCQHQTFNLIYFCLAHWLLTGSTFLLKTFVPNNANAYELNGWVVPFSISFS